MWFSMPTRGNSEKSVNRMLESTFWSSNTALLRNAVDKSIGDSCSKEHWTGLSWVPGIIFVDVVVYGWNVCSEMGPLCSRFHDNEVRVKALSFTERKAFFFNMTCVGIKLPSRYQAASSVLSRETNAVTRAEPMRVGCIGWLVAAKFVVTCVEPRNINPTTHNIRMMNNG